MVWSESEEKYAQIRHCLQAKTVQNSPKQIMWVDFDARHNRRWAFSLDEALLWIISSGLKLKRLNDQCVSYMETLEWCGLLVNYCDVFISCLDSHSDGTHSLQRIHCWDSDAVLYFSKTVHMKKQTRLQVSKWVGECSANFHFWVNYYCNHENKVARNITTV